MSSPPPLPPEIDRITEPILLGHLLQWALFGVLSVQVYIYYLAFPGDPLQRKFLVYAVYAAEMLQVIILARMAYIQFAADFGNRDALNAIPVILWLAIPVLGSIVASVVQIFYAYRMKLLADSYIIPSVVVMLALIQLGGGIALGVLTAKAPFYSELTHNRTTIPGFIAAHILYGCSAFCDVLIAVYMTYLLSKRETNMRKTRWLVHKITRLIIGTGMLTAAIAIVNLVLFLIPTNAGYFVTTTAVLGKMYSNTMMVLLNSRMVFGIADDAVSSHELLFVVTSQRSAFFTSQQVGASVTHEQRSDSLQVEDFTTVTRGQLERQDLNGRISLRGS